MELWDNDDQETPIEEYPGYLGVSSDGTVLVGPELRPLRKFDLENIANLSTIMAEGVNWMSVYLQEL